MSTEDDWLPNPVMVQKLQLLFGQGYRTAGVLLSTEAEPHRLVGVTEYGKVTWWPATAPEPDEMARIIVEWLSRDADRTIAGALLHMGMALGTIRKLQQEVSHLKVEVEHYRLQTLALLEREAGVQDT